MGRPPFATSARSISTTCSVKNNPLNRKKHIIFIQCLWGEGISASADKSKALRFVMVTVANVVQIR
jgi:hypothetical protein